MVVAGPLLVADGGDIAAEFDLVAEAGQRRAGEGVQRRARFASLLGSHFVALAALCTGCAGDPQGQHRRHRPTSEPHRALPRST